MLSIQRIAEIEEAFTSYTPPVGDEHYDEYGDSWGWHDWEEALEDWWKKTKGPKPSVHLPGVGKVTLQENHGGGEGSGEERWLVFKVEMENPLKDGVERYFMINGYYQSYDGSTFDGPFSEVKPVVREVTFYE